MNIEKFQPAVSNAAMERLAEWMDKNPSPDFGDEANVREWLDRVEAAGMMPALQNLAEEIFRIGGGE